MAKQQIHPESPLSAVAQDQSFNVPMIPQQPSPFLSSYILLIPLILSRNDSLEAAVASRDRPHRPR